MSWRIVVLRNVRLLIVVYLSVYVTSLNFLFDVSYILLGELRNSTVTKGTNICYFKLVYQCTLFSRCRGHLLIGISCVIISHV